MENADVVIIGGGVNGASTAFNLTSLGVRRVIVVERRHLGAGASEEGNRVVVATSVEEDAVTAVVALVPVHRDPFASAFHDLQFCVFVVHRRMAPLARKRRPFQLDRDHSRK